MEENPVLTDDTYCVKINDDSTPPAFSRAGREAAQPRKRLGGFCFLRRLS